VTATTPVERVANALEAANFTRMATPLQIAGLTIPVASAFIGGGNSPDLVIVGDTVSETQKKIQQTIEGVGRALDMVQSRRPLTLVLVGPRPESSALSAMAKFARVLPVGEIADQDSINNWLAVLFPLKLPVLMDGMLNVEAVLGAAFQQDEMSQSLIAIANARQGEDAVRTHFHALIEAAFVGDEFLDASLDDTP
jgi:hypothetical protein